MGAEESEKLFRELVMQLFGYTGQLSIPEIGAAVIPEIHACVSKNEKETEEKPDAMKEPEEYMEDKYFVDPVTEPEPIRRENDGYGGFLHIKCKHCGKEKTYCSSHKIKYHKCEECGEETKLKDLVQLYTNCECGRKAAYWTNMTEKAFDVRCVDCGSNVQQEKEPVRDNTVARKCMRGGDAGGDDGKRQEKGVPAKIPGM